MPYQTSVEFRGDTAALMQAARLTLIGQGFAVSEPGAGHLIAIGPWMTGSRQPPLSGFSSLEIEVTPATLTITAGRRNIILLILFILLFPPVLALVLGITQGKALIGLRAVVPWLIVSPLLSLWLWYRTKSALDRLVANLLRIGSLPR